MPHTRQQGRPDLPKLLTLREFAYEINRHPSWVRIAILNGRIPAAQKVGERWIIPADALVRPAHVTLDNRLLDIGIPEEFLGGETYYGAPPVYPSRGGDGTLGGRGPRASYVPNLRNVRESQSMTRYALERKAGVAHHVVRRAEEGGRLTPKTIIKLAKALDVDYVDLLREAV